MDVAVLGTGTVGTTLGRALAAGGHRVTFGTRHPEGGSDPTGAALTTIGEAIAAAEVVVVALPGPAVAEVARAHAEALAGKLVVDAANSMGAPVANHAADFGPTVRYARAFNSLGVENFADPVYADGPADLFYSAPVADREVVAELIGAVGLRPQYTGEDPAIPDGVFRLWIALVMGQRHSRHTALRLVERPL